MFDDDVGHIVYSESVIAGPAIGGIPADAAIEHVIAGIAKKLVVAGRAPQKSFPA